MAAAKAANAFWSVLRPMNETGGKSPRMYESGPPHLEIAMTEHCDHCKVELGPGEKCFMLMDTEISADGIPIPFADVKIVDDHPDIAIFEDAHQAAVLFCSDECVRDYFAERCIRESLPKEPKK